MKKGKNKKRCKKDTVHEIWRVRSFFSMLSLHLGPLAQRLTQHREVTAFPAPLSQWCLRDIGPDRVDRELRNRTLWVEHEGGEQRIRECIFTWKDLMIEKGPALYVDLITGRAVDA